MTVLALLWPREHVAEAIAATARAAGLPLDDAAASVDPANATRSTPPSAKTRDALLRWATFAAEGLGLEAELVVCPFRELDALLGSLGPALLPIRQSDGELGLLALLGRRGRSLVLVGPDGRTAKRSLTDVRAAVAAAFEESLDARGLPALLEAAGVPSHRREAALRAIAADQYGGAVMGPFLMLRPHPAASLGAQARHAGLGRTTAELVLAHVARMAAVIASFWFLGRGALSGHFELGWLVAWGLLLASTIPLGAIATHTQGRFAIVVGRLVKQRLLYGTLRLSQDAMRREGAGSMLGRVLESNAVEAMFLAGALGAALAIVDLVLAAWVLSQGAGGSLSLAILLATVLTVALVVARFYVRGRRWTDERLAMTHDLVERMVGHRTRLAQEPTGAWHEDEDHALDRYLVRSEELDGGALWVSLLPRGWMLVAALGLAPAFLAGADATSMAVSVGGIVLGLGALTALTNGLRELAFAAIAWRRVQPIFAAATRPPPPGDVESVVATPDPGPVTDRARPTGAHAQQQRALLVARELVLRHAGRERPVLDRCSLAIRHGERVLLTGPSGGGKSTLAAVLGGLRDPSSGVLLLDGLDPASLGSSVWRERVATVPQFHENHVLSASFAFNALMGAEWPPSRAKLDELEAVCAELGLGPLLDRMPARLEQMVGESGWKLSHGERSRLFLARALLASEARLWILDESFAALDPITLEQCVSAVLRRAPTLLVVAHP